MPLVFAGDEAGDLSFAWRLTKKPTQLALQQLERQAATVGDLIAGCQKSWDFLISSAV
jgi:hypothetical protein